MNILDIANNLPGGNNQQNSQFAPSPNDTPRIRALKEKLAKKKLLELSLLQINNIVVK